MKVEEVPATVLSQEEETPDIFHDMEPNLQKTKKVKWREGGREACLFKNNYVQKFTVAWAVIVTLFKF